MKAQARMGLEGFEPATTSIMSRFCSGRNLSEHQEVTTPAEAGSPDWSPGPLQGDPELKAVVAAWADLPEPIRAGITAVVAAARGASS